MLSKFEKNFFVVVSYVLHPIFVPLYINLFLFINKNFSYFYTIYNFKIFYLILTYTTLFTIIIPLIIFYILKRCNVIQSLTEPSKQEVLLMNIIISTSYLVLNFLSLDFIFLNDVFEIYLMSAILLNIFLLITKFSIHSFGWVAGLSTFILISIDYDIYINTKLWQIIIITLLSGLAINSRIFLSVHNNIQIIKGSFLGLITSIISFLVLKFLYYEI